MTYSLMYFLRPTNIKHATCRLCGRQFQEYDYLECMKCTAAHSAADRCCTMQKFKSMDMLWLNQYSKLGAQACIANSMCLVKA